MIFAPRVRRDLISLSVKMSFDIGTLVIVAVLFRTRTRTLAPFHVFGNATEAFLIVVIVACVM